MIAVRDGAVGFVDIRDERIDESLAEARTCFEIPVAVIWEDDGMSNPQSAPNGEEFNASLRELIA